MLTPSTLAKIIRGLNLVDVIGTLFAVQVAGIEVELNPVMRWLLEIHPAVFVVAKIVLVAVWSEFVAIYCKPEWIARWGFTVVLIGYVIAVALHASNVVRYFHG